MLHLVVAVCVLAVSASATPYTLFISEDPIQGNGDFYGACQNSATQRHLNPGLVFPLMNGSTLLSSWSTSRRVFGPTGIQIGTGATLKSNALALALSAYGVGTIDGSCAPFWTGLTTNFAATATGCNGWTTNVASPTGTVGSCASLNFLDGNLQLKCNLAQFVLCVYTGATFTPSTSPTSSKPSVSPSRAPSRAPTSSHPSVAPSSSKPSASPSTSTPTKNPVRATAGPTPFTGSPTDSGGGTGAAGSAQELAVPVGAGVGGGVALLFLLAVVVVLSRRRKARRTSNLSNIGK